MSNWYNIVEVMEFEEAYDPAYLNLDPNDENSWKIYAAKIRNIMSKALDVPKVQMGYRDYKAFGKIFKKARKLGPGKHEH